MTTSYTTVPIAASNVFHSRQTRTIQRIICLLRRTEIFQATSRQRSHILPLMTMQFSAMHTTLGKKWRVKTISIRLLSKTEEKRLTSRILGLQRAFRLIRILWSLMLVPNLCSMRLLFPKQVQAHLFGHLLTNQWLLSPMERLRLWVRASALLPRLSDSSLQSVPSKLAEQILLPRVN